MIQVLESEALFQGLFKRAVVKVGQTREEKILIIFADDFFNRLC